LTRSPDIGEIASVDEDIAIGNLQLAMAAVRI
jgi:hypothetical protein